MSYDEVDVKVIDKGGANLEQIRKMLLSLKKKEIQIGILSDAGINEESGTAIVDYAIANEFGVGNNPERSFLRSTFDEQGDKWSGILNKIVDSVIEGKTDVQNKIEQAGAVMVGDVKEKILSNIPPANHPKTTAKKKSNRTLIDTGAMLKSINFKIISK